MTTKTAGKQIVGSYWLTLKRLREHWVLIAFLSTTLFWARDVYEEFIFLPRKVEAIDKAVRGLTESFKRFESDGQVRESPRGQILSFPGLTHSVSDGRPGEWVDVHLFPVLARAHDCRPGSVLAWMIDSAGSWYSVKTDLMEWPKLGRLQELAFAVELHPRMETGRARFLLQIVHDCGGRLQVDSSPHLHFRVLGADLP